MVVLGKREELRSPASDRSGKREESTIQRRDRTAAAAAAMKEDINCGWPARRACRYGRYPGGKREETTATGDFRRFFWVLFRVESSSLRVTEYLTFRQASIRSSWSLDFVWVSISIPSEEPFPELVTTSLKLFYILLH